MMLLSSIMIHYDIDLFLKKHIGDKFAVIGNSPLVVWMVRYQAFQYTDQGFESHSHHF